MQRVLVFLLSLVFMVCVPASSGSSPFEPDPVGAENPYEGYRAFYGCGTGYRSGDFMRYMEEDYGVDEECVEYPEKGSPGALSRRATGGPGAEGEARAPDADPARMKERPGRDEKRGAEDPGMYRRSGSGLVKRGGGAGRGCLDVSGYGRGGGAPGAVSGAQGGDCLQGAAGAAAAGQALTPMAMKALKERREYRGLRPDEVVRGQKLLGKKGTSEGKDGEKGAPAGAAVRGEERTFFERYHAGKPSQEVQEELKPFGYELFRDSDLTPPEYLPAPSDYVIGPGDEINVLLWGRVSADYLLTVSRDGTVLFPDIGPLSVAGMKFDDMETLLKQKAREIVGAEITITMGRLRSIQVFVLGEVKSPGAYTVSAMTTVTNALLHAGGPTEIGSMRKVELKRGDRTVAALDLYELLLKGDRSGDARLASGDVVFVPVAGPLVGITGEVKRPAVYELKGEEDLAGALELAGGALPTAYAQQIQVERVERSEKRVVVDVDALDAELLMGFKLGDADMVKVFSIAGREKNAVFLFGNVRRPGKYEMKEGMKASDVIGGRQGLLPETHLAYGLIKRVATPNGEVRLVPFNIGAALDMDTGEDPELAPGDSVYVFSKWFFSERPVVTIEGEVRSPGSYLMEENMTVRDLVLMAGALTKDASLGPYELYRTDPASNETTLEKHGLEEALKEQSPDNVVLKDLDRVVIHPVWEQSPPRYVTITGDVNRPGRYIYASNMRVRDLVFAGGGQRESAYMKEAEIATKKVVDGKTTKVAYRTVDLRKALAGDPDENAELRPYDTLHVKKMADWDMVRYAEIRGEVVFPGRYVIKKGERLSSLIERAGGFSGSAYLRGAVFTRESVREMQQKRLDEAVDRAERMLLSSSVESVEMALSAESAKQMHLALAYRKALIEKMRSARAKGRISIVVAGLEELKSSPYDIALEDGDHLEVPAVPTQVQVVGAVFNPSAFVHRRDTTVSGYIRKAGGLTKDADKDELYILKADGTAVSKREHGGSWGLVWDKENSEWVSGGFTASRLEPGDTLVVPEETERIAWLREVKDITQILYQIAVTAGVLIVAF